MKSENLEKLAPFVLRLALSGVYLWFGVSQLVSSKMWVGMVPPWASGLFGFSSTNIVQMNGAFEVVAGTLLALGFLVRPVAALLSVHLLVIAADLGLNAIGVRDFGLGFATLAIALSGQDDYSVWPAKKEAMPPQPGQIQ